jgi:hypothetical protein
LGKGNDPVYIKTRCFDPFPFPDASGPQRNRIRALAESLDRHCKSRLSTHPDLTLTGLYNALEMLDAGEELSAKQRDIHERGLVGTLREIHREIDLAVADAYGWPPDLTDGQVLTRLVELNAERAEEERNGIVRWLRPEFQAPEAKEVQTAMAGVVQEAPVAGAAVASWPRSLPERVAAIHELLAEGGDWTVEQVARRFRRARRRDVLEVLSSLAALGLAVRFSADSELRWRRVDPAGRAA